MGIDGAIYVSGVGVFAFDAQGSPLWENPGFSCTSVTSSDAGSIYFVCDGQLLAFDWNGAWQWTVPLPHDKRLEDGLLDLPSTVAADGEIFQPALNQLLRLGPDGAIRSRWIVTVEKGDLSVSRGNGHADCVVRAQKALFDRIAAGKVNAVAAVLRGDLEIDGDWRLLVWMQRLFPGRRGQRHTGTAGYARRRR